MLSAKPQFYATIEMKFCTLLIFTKLQCDREKNITVLLYNVMTKLVLAILQEY